MIIPSDNLEDDVEDVGEYNILYSEIPVKRDLTTQYDNESDGFLSYISTKRQGISTGIPKLDKQIHGVLQGMYYLIGGGSNSGKTTFLDYCFLLQMLISNKPIKLFYYSFEIGEYRKYAKIIAHWLYIYDKVELGDMDVLNVTDVDIKPYMDKIKKYYYKFKSDIKGKIQFRFNPTNPTQVYKDLRKYAEENGVFEKKYATNNEGEKIIVGEKYIPNKPDELVLILIDHIGLASKERGFTKKDNMDKLSEYCVLFRNLCNYSFVVLQQFNRGISSIDRQKLKGDDLLPTDADFSDTSNTYQDSDVALTMFNPSKYGLTSCQGVPVNKNNRIITILKSRVGEADISILVDFNGKVNYIKQSVK